jgi:serine-type D-Ala-D-Ala carboxypeptidase (penicillin-binding protein 5/6)
MKRAGVAVSLLLSIFMMPAMEAQAIKKAPKAQKPQASVDHFANVQVYPGASTTPVMAKQAILIDFNTGKVLLEKNADERMAPSSMTKMMTTYIMEEEILKGKISNETEFLVSKKAWETQGSKMFVHVNDKVKVADLHKGIAIQSGNDASIVVAEGIMGTEAGFALEMTRVAKELGMNGSNFKNAHGLHEEDHYSTARDLSKLANAIIKDHSKFYSVNSEKEFSYNGIKQGNRNPLLYDDIGCDGLKTGHTDAGGFGVTVSCLDGAQRYILVVNGLPSVQARADEARTLIGWAKGNFIGKTVVKKGDIVEKAAKVSIGVKETVPLVAARDVYMLMLRTEQNKTNVTHTINASLTAPLKQGDRGGVLVATTGDSRVEVELLVAEDVEKLGWFKRMLLWFKGCLQSIGFA